jgi:hypothetical protein
VATDLDHYGDPWVGREDRRRLDEAIDLVDWPLRMRHGIALRCLYREEALAFKRYIETRRPGTMVKASWIYQRKEVDR